MTKLICLASAAVMALSIPAAAEAQNGNGNGNGKGRGEQGQDRGNRGDRGERGEGRGRGDDNRGRGNDDRRGNDNRAERQLREMARGAEGRRVEVVRVEDGRGRGRDDWRDDRRRDRDGDRWERDVRRTVVNVTEGRPVVVFRDTRDRDFIVGCPPGLAKKNNGCLPPGQAKKIARANYDYPRYDWVWGQRRNDWNYQYNDGYLYRVNQSGGLLGYLPVLGGALSLGNVWPSQYQYQQVPTYYSDYYGLNDRYNYRYADGALYGLDPRTQAISQVAALLTGQQWNVGQQMPSGYDVYNVPYAYRSQYMDSPDSWYRYNDGYVYQVDPTTRLVQTVIQLLT